MEDTKKATFSISYPGMSLMWDVCYAHDELTTRHIVGELIRYVGHAGIESFIDEALWVETEVYGCYHISEDETETVMYDPYTYKTKGHSQNFAIDFISEMIDELLGNDDA